MKIKRTIGTQEVEIKLTEDELAAAYFEQEHIFDVQSIADFFSELSDDEVYDDYGRTRSEISAKYDELAYEMRRNIDKYNMDWYYARDAAISELL